MIPFSVLMSVYIKEQACLLDKALHSVLVEQTVKPSELVLVEDGELTEDLYTVIQKYQKEFSITVIKLPQNGGLGNALNIGLQKCNNEWIARMDSDDISLPRRFEKQLYYIENHPDVDVLGCSLLEFDNDEREIKAIKSCPENIDSYIKWRCPINHPTVFFKKSSVLQAGSYQHCLYMEDYHLWIRMYALGMKITSLQEGLYLFKMDVNAQKRRGGRKYLASELEIQSLLLKKHIISLPQYFINIIIRGGARLIPSKIRGLGYNMFLRKKKLKTY